VIPRFYESFRAERLRAMFAISPGDRMEIIHPADAGRAVANAVSSAAVVGKTLLIAGGPSCQRRRESGSWANVVPRIVG
jgi:hypothetical protein